MSGYKLNTKLGTAAVGIFALYFAAMAGDILCAEPLAQTDGLRTLESRHLTLITDLPTSAEVDQLPELFDQAISQWARYFRVPQGGFANWKVRGYLMQHDARFRAAGLLPDDLPPFLHGYQRGDSFWLREQPSDYYRRHLLLHEGTHAFMYAALQGVGSAWYCEGIAEYLATHRWHQGRLKLARFPENRNEVPHWGRIKIIRDAIAAGRRLSFADVFRIDGADFRHVDAYAWSWAAIVFLQSDSRFSKRFSSMQGEVELEGEPFTAAFWNQMQVDPQRLDDAWQAFLNDLDYGLPPRTQQIEYRSIEPLAGKQRRTVATDRGWQSTGIRLQAGKRYLVRARGRYQLKKSQEFWSSSPSGVTLEYYRGLPMGMLIAACVDRESGNHAFAQTIPVGEQATMQPVTDVELFLKVNESATELLDNQGDLLVQIEEAEMSPN